MAEVEITALVRQCLKRRLPDEGTLRREAEVWAAEVWAAEVWAAEAWAAERNRLGTSVEWRFTTEDVRTKLRSLYPSVEECRRNSPEALVDANSPARW